MGSRQHEHVRVLVVDDEPQLRRALERALKLEGYEVELAADGEQALGSIASAPMDAIVLDVLMPKRDGLEVARELRARGDRTPILMLTARDAVQDRVDGLDAGADDYVVKPFALEELLARLRALLRRTNGDAGERLIYSDLTLDPATREVARGDRAVQLTKTEFALLEHLMRHPRLVLSRSQLFEAVWGYDFGPRSNSLEVYIGYLRRKTEEDGEPRLIQTVRGVGYSQERVALGFACGALAPNDPALPAGAALGWRSPWRSCWRRYWSTRWSATGCGDIDHDLRQQAERVTQRFAAAPPPGAGPVAAAGAGTARTERGEQYALTLPAEPGGPEAPPR
jgi:two-component system response regulator MprA